MSVIYADTDETKAKNTAYHRDMRSVFSLLSAQMQRKILRTRRINKMKRIITIIALGVAIVVIALLSWQMIALRRNVQERMDVVNLMISRYEAKAQFIEDYLPAVNTYTGSEITAKRILSAVYENSLQYDLSPELILAVIKVESEFNPKAYSDAGAIGLMQLMPITGRYVGRSLGLWIDGKEDLYDIEKNIQIGTVFLKECIERLGEQRGLGYYYAGRNTKYYHLYTRRVAAARKLWIAKTAALTYNVQ
jgi:soluble lytic murein transglycosylase-like protein